MNELPIEAISPDPNQPRKRFDEELLMELADSIAEHGVIQPILVRPAEEAGRYVIIAGERRWRASKLAFRKTIPAVIADGEMDIEAVSVAENVARANLNPIEEARAFRGLLNRMTKAQLAKSIGRSVAYIDGRLQLLLLEEPIRPYVASGEMNVTAAIQIASLDPTEQLTIAGLALDNGLTNGQIAAAIAQERQQTMEIPGTTLEARRVKDRYEVVVGQAIGAINAMLDPRTLTLLPEALQGDVPMELERLRLLERAVGMLRDGISAAAARAPKKLWGE